MNFFSHALQDVLSYLIGSTKFGTSKSSECFKGGVEQKEGFDFYSFWGCTTLPAKPCILTGFELIGSKWKKKYEKGQNFV